MIPLDRYEKWAPVLDECAQRYLDSSEMRAYRSIPETERMHQLRSLLERPIARYSTVNEAYFRARWAEAVQQVFAGNAPVVLEVGTGDADMIPQMLARAYPRSRYSAVNRNRRLSKRLLANTQGLALEFRLIEADAGEIETYLPPESVDVIAFQHAINDVIQASLCEREGVDTVEADWMETLPRMIAILQREIAHATFEAHAKPAFLGLLAALLRVLKPGGTVVMNHYMFQLDLDWGYPPDLFENMVPITRTWLGELAGCREVFWDGFPAQWWIFLRKT